MSTALPTTDVLFPTPRTSLPQVEGPAPKRWTRAEYHRLDELGVFRGQRVELIDGEIIQLSPQSPQHYTAIRRLTRWLEDIFGSEYEVRPQGPTIEGDYSEPEPDLCVVKGKIEDFDEEHPTRGCLFVEVAKTSLSYDRGKKQHLYALMGVPDYWILDLAGRQLLVHRDPIADETAPLGHRYNSVETILQDGTVAPLEKPEAKLAVAEMLSPVEKSQSSAPGEA